MGLEPESAGAVWALISDEEAAPCSILQAEKGVARRLLLWNPQ